MAHEAPSRKRIGKPDWDRLIPELKGYLDPGPTEPEVWAYCESGLEVAVGFTELYWPPFIEINGLIVRDAHDGIRDADSVTRLESWVETCAGNLSAAERMTNHVHLIDIFAFRFKPMDPNALAYLGRVLQDMWSAKLKVDFPSYDCRVDLYLPEHDIEAWQITFYRLRDGDRPIE